MRQPQIIQQKIYDLPGLQHQLSRWKLLGKTVAFTNGCFDILHRGHIASLSDAACEADYLVVGLNSDASTGRLKGPGVPSMTRMPAPGERSAISRTLRRVLIAKLSVVGK